MENPESEFWMRGPVDGIAPLLQPVAHALLQARVEVKNYCSGFSDSSLWLTPRSVASVGFHLRHVTGVLDRLFTYARDSSLSEAQLPWLASEGLRDEKITTTELIGLFSEQVEHALLQLKETDEASLLSPRGIGRKKIPSNVIGLLFHAAEHVQRHIGQMMVTIKMLNG